MTLHTTPGCSMSHNPSQTGTTLGMDCGSSQNNNVGRVVKDANTKSHEKPLAVFGEGVWVTQFDTSGIRIQ